MTVLEIYDGPTSAWCREHTSDDWVTIVIHGAPGSTEKVRLTITANQLD